MKSTAHRIDNAFEFVCQGGALSPQVIVEVAGRRNTLHVGQAARCAQHILYQIQPKSLLEELAGHHRALDLVGVLVDLVDLGACSSQSRQTASLR